MICARIVISDLPNKSPAEFASVRASAAAAKFLCPFKASELACAVVKEHQLPFGVTLGDDLG